MSDAEHAQEAPPTTQRLVILHSSPIVADALGEALLTLDSTVAIETMYSWADFARTWDFAPAWAVVDAYLDDHVPLALKVRSLVREHSGVIVLGTLYSPTPRDRARAEGASAWLEPSASLGDTAATIAHISAQRPDTHPSLDGQGTHLTDRELQLASLHASRRGLTPASIGRSLGLSPATVKAHIASARRKYRAHGIPVRSREELASALVADGYLIPSEHWQHQARW